MLVEMHVGNAWRLGARSKRGLAAVAILVASSACTQAPRARPVLGPDGSAVWHVSCGGDQGACFELAGQSCPHGYQLTPIFDPSSNNFLVRCRDRVTLLARAAHPTPGPAVITPLPAPPPTLGTEWPPPAEPAQPAYPWATVTEGSTVLPETARLPNGQVDLGY